MISCFEDLGWSQNGKHLGSFLHHWDLGETCPFIQVESGSRSTRREVGQCFSQLWSSGDNSSITLALSPLTPHFWYGINSWTSKFPQKWSGQVCPVS